MYETLRDLHRKCYTRAVMPELECDYDDAFQQLMSRLSKPERKWNDHENEQSHGMGGMSGL